MIPKRTRIAASTLSIFALLCCAMLLQPVRATKLDADLTGLATSAIPGGTVRLDGSISAHGSDLFLPLLPVSAANKKSAKPEIELRFPEQKPDLIFYSNGWAHVRLHHKGEMRTIVVPKELPEKYRKRLNALRFPSDLIVPERFVLPKSLKVWAGDVNLTVLDDATIASSDFGIPVKKTATKQPYTGSGSVFLTSITQGCITMLDGKTLNKIAEFPTEGTPCSMEILPEHLYIADQAKDRVLILDPYGRKFASQIDLTTRSAPKGIAALPNGKWIYVSESGAGDIAVVETATGKVLMKTKVKPGPGQMAVTPDGVFLLVVNVTSGEVSVISTYNQKVISVIKVGELPTNLVISKDSRHAYVSNRNSNTVSQIDIKQRSIAGTIKTAAGPTGLALSPNADKLYVACGRDNVITVYDTKTLTKLGEMRAPAELDFPGGICMLPGGERLLVLSLQSGNVGVMDTSKLEFTKVTSLGHPSNEAIWAPVP